MSYPELFFKSINPDAPRTLVLLHGGFCSHHEWDLVSQSYHLSSYHLLIPDLPAHGSSTSASISFNLPDTASLLADLITKHAKNGKAGLVGLSLGGYTSIYLAQKYPGIVSEGVFVTGCGHSWPSPNSVKSWGIAMLMFLFNAFIMSLPRQVFEWLAEKRGLKVNDDLYEAMKLGVNYRLARTISRTLGEEGGETWKERYEKVQARTCIVAGATHDFVGACSKRGVQLRKGNLDSCAFKIEGMQHTWSVQDPELFARGIKCWMERKPLPDEFISLN